MIRKFSFWTVLILIALSGSMAFVHWRTIQEFHQRTAGIQPLFQRQKVLESLNLKLERYRRTSTSFRKFEPEELMGLKNKLRIGFAEGVSQLDRLDPTEAEIALEAKLNEQLKALLDLSAEIEPMLFSKDAYIRPEVQAAHEKILSTLQSLEASADKRMQALHFDSAPSQSEFKSVFLLLGIAGAILVLVLITFLRNHFAYVRPIRKLKAFAEQLKNQKTSPETVPRLSGDYAEVQTALVQLCSEVENHMKDRHKFILDIVSDLKSPLTLLQEGKLLLQGGPEADEQQQIEAAESVRRGLAIFSGSLDDLNDIADINRLESRLEQRTVDLSELISDVSRTLMGSELGKRISFQVPPMPVWVSIDVRRFERVLIQLLSKVISTLPPGGGVSMSVAQTTQGSFRGVEVQIQDLEKVRNGRGQGGPEQDILKHWISETGLSMALAHKVIRAHGGTITAAGVAGTSINLVIRLPQDRIVSRGLISPPILEDSGVPVRGLVVQASENKGSSAQPKTLN